MEEQKLDKTTMAEESQQFSIARSRLEEAHSKASTTRFVLLLVLVCLILLLVSFYIRIRNLENFFPLPYKWWKTGSYSDIKNPPALGPRKISVESCAISSVYPSFAWMMGLAFVATPLKPASAEFLLQMVSVFGEPLYSKGKSVSLDGLTAAHWNGSEDQLHFSEYRSFLPPPQQGGIYLPTTQKLNWSYIYHCWTAPVKGGKEGETANPWHRRIWPNEQAFVSSPMINDYYKKGRVDAVEALFRGGLTEYALTMEQENKSAEDMLYYFVGEQPVQAKAKCQPGQDVAEGFSSFTTGMGMAAPLFMNPYTAVLGVLGSAAFGVNSAMHATCGQTQQFPKTTEGLSSTP